MHTLVVWSARPSLLIFVIVWCVAGFVPCQCEALQAPSSAYQHFAGYTWPLFTVNSFCFFFPTPSALLLLLQVQVKVDMPRAHGPSFLFELVKCGTVSPGEMALQPGTSDHRNHMQQAAKVQGRHTTAALYYIMQWNLHGVFLQVVVEKAEKIGSQRKSRVPAGSAVEEECRQTESSLYSLCVRLQTMSLQASFM